LIKTLRGKESFTKETKGSKEKRFRKRKTNAERIGVDMK